MTDQVENIEVFIVSLEQETPYLGDLLEGESINSQGYFVRKGNRTVYPRHNRSLVVRLRTRDGAEGWGETYGLVAPKATAEIITDLLTSFVVGRNPLEVEDIHETLYDLMRVRGYTGGFYLDALAAIDIALWDIVGKLKGDPLGKLLGNLERQEIPAYVSGLPRNSLQERCNLAQEWQSRGFDSFKFALPIADRGALEEISALRNQLGARSRIACDMHWSHTAKEAVSLANEIASLQPWFLEAPVATEDIDGLAWVAQNTECSIAAGEEWRTLFEAKARIDRQACQIVQPEMGHTGVTQFVRIANYAKARNLAVMPHATIGAGIFLAASLQASTALENVVCHEYQHSIFDEFLPYTTGGMKCKKGAYQVPTGFGLGVEPTDLMKSKMTQYS